MMRQADTNDDGVIDFDEFVVTSKSSGDGSGHSPDPLSWLVPKLAYLEKQGGVPRALGACLAGASARVAAARAAALGAFPATRAAYLRTSGTCAALVTWPPFDHVIIFCILLVGLATFMQVEYNRAGDAPAWMRSSLDAVASTTLAVFTVEVRASLTLPLARRGRATRFRATTARPAVRDRRVRRPPRAR